MHTKTSSFVGLAAVLVVTAFVDTRASATTPYFRELRVGSAWTYTLEERDESATVTTGEVVIRVVGERAVPDVGQVYELRFELPSGEAFTPVPFMPGGLPEEVILGRRGLRLDARSNAVLTGNSPRARHRPPHDRIFVHPHPRSVGCFGYVHPSPVTGDFYSWRLCFGGMGDPVEYVYDSVWGTVSLTHPRMTSGWLF